MGFPGLITTEYGAGKVVYVPGECGAIYDQEGFAEHKQLIKNALKWLASNQLLLRTNLLDTVDLTLTQNVAGDVIVPFVNATADLSCPCEYEVAVIELLGN